MKARVLEKKYRRKVKRKQDEKVALSWLKNRLSTGFSLGGSLSAFTLAAGHSTARYDTFMVATRGGGKPQ